MAPKKGAYRDRRRAAGVCVPAAAGALGPGLRNTPSLCSRWIIRTSPMRCGSTSAVASRPDSPGKTSASAPDDRARSRAG
jgi:hypothetical protein